MMPANWSKACCKHQSTLVCKQRWIRIWAYSHADRKTKAQVETTQQSNHRNGAYTKTINSGYGALEMTMPRDRASTFAPKMVPKGSHRLRITRRHDHLTVRRRDDRARYLPPSFHHPGVDMSPDTISTITDAVLEEVMIW